LRSPWEWGGGLAMPTNLTPIGRTLAVALGSIVAAHLYGRLRNKQLKHTQMSNSNQAREASRAEGRSPFLLWLIWVVWVPLSIPAFLRLFQAHLTLPHLIATLFGVTLFFVIYLLASWRRALDLVATSTLPKHTDALTWLVIAALTLLSLILTLLGGSEWQTLFYYTSGYVGGSLLIRRAILVVFVITLLATVVGWFASLGWLDLAQTIVFIPAIVFITRSVMWSITTSWQLHDARKEIARLAVMTERLRIARDLHDLLGHNLSLIALKSELARRLVGAAPERAIVEISDVENVARTTLQEVREAVSAFRQPTLKSELSAAQEILAAAGIAYRFDGDDSMINALPTTIEAVLSWTVREGVTNVIRHSRAHQCTIRVTRDAHQIGIEIIDDGTGASFINGSDNEGNGLRGLTERVETLGGRYEASPREGGGFLLAVSVPLVQQNHGAIRPDTITATLSQQVSVDPPAGTDSSIERSERE
jgi:two-component system, NarL family, sensor histidine kinase DesK